MDPATDALFIIIIAILIDLIIGEVPNSIHPLRWMGSILYWIDKHVKKRSGAGTRLIGLLSFLFVFLLFAVIAFVILAVVRNYLGEWPWIIVSAIFLKITFAISSFRRHVKPIAKELNKGRIENARKKVQMIVSRDTSKMDAEHIASSCTETTSENYIDSIVSPTLYSGMFGLIGGLFFRCANLMDAMWGYLNDKYGDLGFFPAKLDDILGYIPARISPIFITIGAFLMGLDWKAVIPATMEEHTKTPSPNSGWPMTAFAAALDIKMEKTGVYVMGKGHLPTHDDMRKCCRLLEVSSLVFILLISLPLYAFIGIHIQTGLEDILIGMLGTVL